MAVFQLERVYKRVKANKGAPGIDGITIEDLKAYLREHKEQIIPSLLDGSYEPQPVRKVMIPKPGGGERQVIATLNRYLNGWLTYFKLASAKRVMAELDAWIRRKLRCYRLKQRKRGSSIAKWLVNLGVSEKDAWKIGASGKGWRRLSLTQAVHRALNNAWFKDQGLINLEETWARLFNTQLGTAVCNQARTVV